jgi:hypothetical protein
MHAANTFDDFLVRALNKLTAQTYPAPVARAHLVYAWWAQYTILHDGTQPFCNRGTCARARGTIEVQWELSTHCGWFSQVPLDGMGFYRQRPRARVKPNYQFGSASA